MDYYEILQVHRNATAEELRAAYKRAALTHHPDRNPNNRIQATLRFHQISNAYEVLSDPTRRGEFDRKLAEQTQFSRYVKLGRNVPCGFSAPGGMTSMTSHWVSPAQEFRPAMDVFEDVFGSRQVGHVDGEEQTQTRGATGANAASASAPSQSPLSAASAAPSCRLFGAYLDPFDAVFSTREKYRRRPETSQSTSQTTSREQSHSPAMDKVFVDDRASRVEPCQTPLAPQSDHQKVAAPSSGRPRPRPEPLTGTTDCMDIDSSRAAAAPERQAHEPTLKTGVKRQHPERLLRKSATFDFDVGVGFDRCSPCGWERSDCNRAGCNRFDGAVRPSTRKNKPSRWPCKGKKLSSMYRHDLVSGQPTICEPPKAPPSQKRDIISETKSKRCRGCKKPTGPVTLCKGHDCPLGRILAWFGSVGGSALESIRNSFDSKEYQRIEDDSSAHAAAKCACGATTLQACQCLKLRRSSSEEPPSSRQCCNFCGHFDCICKSGVQAHATSGVEVDAMEDVSTKEVSTLDLSMSAQDAQDPEPQAVREALGGQPLCRVPCINSLGEPALTHRRSGSPNFLRVIDSWDFRNATPRSEERRAEDPSYRM